MALNLRVRGSGASSSNSQALLLNLRGARVNARARASSEYALQLAPEDLPATAPRAVTLLAWALSRYHPFVVAIDGTSADRAAVWREIHNVLDIAYDDEDDDGLDNCLGSFVLMQEGVATASPSHVLAHQPAFRQLCPLVHQVQPSRATDIGATAAPPRKGVTAALVGVFLRHTDPLEHPSSWTHLTMRGALTLLALACAPHPEKVLLVLPEGTIDTGYAAMLVLAWAVADLGLLAEQQLTPEQARAAFDRAVAALTEPTGAPFELVSAADNLPERLAHVDEVFVVNSDSKDALVAALEKRLPEGAMGPVVVDGDPWLSGEVPDARVFDLSAAAEAARREGAVENFCPCCGHCSGGGH